MQNSILATINSWSSEQAGQKFFRCCASANWVESMVKSRPFSSVDKLFEIADGHWESLSKNDWLEAFRGHSKIGDLNSLKKKFSNTETWSKQEQAGMQGSSDQVLIELRDLNLEYEKKYGYIFIVCATGKTAAEMLNILKYRMKNPPETEILTARDEQAKITRIRLEKII